MIKVVKFGGSSLASAEQFKKVGNIIREEESRKYVVPSAPGKRFSEDTKVTDMLYKCYAEAEEGKNFDKQLKAIKERYNEIIKGLGLKLSLEEQFETIKKNFEAKAGKDYAASRGEYLNGIIMANYLGYQFIDAANVICFDENGEFDSEKTNEVCSEKLAATENAVIPGFYGAMPNGKVKTFSRGGSDVTGSIVARAIKADVYENWTDVTGVLAADPRLIQNPAPVGQLRYEELQTLSRVGMQILHEDAVAPVRQAQIPLRICNTHDPENPGTLVRPQMEPGEGQICFAGRRQLAMLRLTCPQEPDAEAKLAAILTQAQLSPFSMQSVCGELTVLLPMKSGSERLHRLQEQAAQALLPQSCTLRENLSILAALCRSTATVPKLLRAVEKSGAPVHLLQKCGACALMLVNDSQYEQSLRAAYSASRDLHD